ncbi:hypothetical protein D3C87_1339040 [compost metagenome]
MQPIGHQPLARFQIAASLPYNVEQVDQRARRIGRGQVPLQTFLRNPQQMRMGIDQARQQGPPREIDVLVGLGQRGTGTADPIDLAATETDRRGIRRARHQGADATVVQQQRRRFVRFSPHTVPSRRGSSTEHADRHGPLAHCLPARRPPSR